MAASRGNSDLVHIEHGNLALTIIASHETTVLTEGVHSFLYSAVKSHLGHTCPAQEDQ